jgi:type IV conjugative transfer system coupling protein TraD
MDNLRRSGLSKWIRGAQITHHEFIMFWQSVKVTLGLGTVLVVATVSAFAWFELDNHERGIAFRSVLASGLIVAGVSDNYPIYYTNRDGEQMEVEARVFVHGPTSKAVWDKVKRGGTRGLLVAMPVFVFALIMFAKMFDRAGKSQTNDSYIRGSKLSQSAREVQKALEKEGEIGPLRIGPIQLPHEYEAAHQLFIGGPGSGKTTLLNEQLDGMRKAGRKAIVYDINGSFVEKFYDPAKDVILNPLDERSPVWRVWDEARLRSDYDTFANAVIPNPVKGDTFWAEAARTTFRAVLKELDRRHGGEATNRHLYEVLTAMNKDQFAALLEGTEAGSIIDKDAEKMMIGIRATIASKLTGFSFLSDVDEHGEVIERNRRFSIKDYLENETHDGWLFITSKNDQISSLRHLITLWVDIAVGHVLSLRPDSSRRVYFVFDELPSLSELPSLQNAMAQGRKHGAAVILGLQSIEQLRDTYGRETAEAITGNCATWTTLRANDAETAKWVSEAIGMTEKAETSEGLSVAGNDMGDRRTTQRQVVARQTVLPSELRGLANLEGFIVMGRGHPVLRFKFPYKPYEEVAAGFLLKDNLETRIKRSGRTDAVLFGQVSEAEKASVATEEKDCLISAEEELAESIRRAKYHGLQNPSDEDLRNENSKEAYGDLLYRHAKVGGQIPYVHFLDVDQIDRSAQAHRLKRRKGTSQRKAEPALAEKAAEIGVLDKPSEPRSAENQAESSTDTPPAHQIAPEKQPPNAEPEDDVFSFEIRNGRPAVKEKSDV